MGMVLFQTAAEVHQGFGQQSPMSKQGCNQQSADAPVAVQKRVDGFKLRMDQGHLDHRWQIRRRVVNEPFHVGQQRGNVLRRWRYENRIAGLRATDPVL